MPARLDPARWRAVVPHLDQALDLSGERRREWLDALGAQDPTLAADVSELLERHQELARERFLEESAEVSASRPSLAGLTLGAYTLKSPIGEGGMGAVWLAERNDGRYQGLAAVKLLNASLMGRDGEARFRREGSILARLQHPHIARLIDAGVSPHGQPYLVLEHVDGERIDRSCDARSLGVEARVRLFLDVLSAVSHAHANLVVHRDLKPSNVLVGADGQVKLLDFGIAKLMEWDTGETLTALTREGESPLTPEYAAPEQLTGGDVTTATDVYALGVLLYVLLTGRHPLGRETSSPAQLIRAIVDTEPQRLSDAVTLGRPEGQGSVEIAARRATTPARLRSALRGDLDNIVAKALKKRPSERYSSVEALADDLRRFLAFEPVSARPDSIGYRAARFLRRHRVAAAAVAAAALAVVLGTAGIAWQAREARQQRDEAQSQLARATAASDFMNVLLTVAAPTGRRFDVTELLEEGALLVDKQFAGNDALRAEMLAIVGHHFMAAERYDRATPLLERAAAIAARSGDPALQARASCPLALLHVAQGDRAAGEQMMAAALAGLPEEPRYALIRAECLVTRSAFGYYFEQAEPMIESARAALDLLERIPAPARMTRLDALASIAYGRYLARQIRLADESYARLWAMLEEGGLDRTSTAASVLNNWSLVHYRGDIRRAEDLCRRSVALRRSVEGERSVLPTATFNHAGALLRLARYAEAEPLFEETIATAAAREEYRTQYDAMMELAEVYLERGELDRAAAQLSRLDQFKGTPRFDSWRQQQLDYHLARLAFARHDYSAARERFESVARRFEARPAKIAMNSLALIGLARTQQAQGETDAALATARRAVELSESFVEPGGPSYLIGQALLAEADVHRARGDAGKARESYRLAIEHLERTLDASHPALAAAKRGAQL